MEQLNPNAPEPMYARHLRSVSRHWKLCVLPAIVVALGSYAASYLFPKSYQAQAVVASINVDYGSNEMNLRGLPLRALAEFFRQGQTVSEVMAKFNLDKPPYNYDLDGFYREVLTVEATKLNETIVVQARINSSELAQQVANEIARRGCENYRTEMQTQYKAMLKYMEDEAAASGKQLAQAEADLEKQQLDARIDTLRNQVRVQLELQASRSHRRASIVEEMASLQGLLNKQQATTWEDNPFIKDANKTLRQAEDDLVKFEDANRVKPLRKEVDVQLASLGDRVRRIGQLGIEIAYTAEKIKCLEAKLAAEPVTIKTDRQLARDPLLQQTLAKLLGKPVPELADLNMIQSQVNPVYSSVKHDLITAQGQYAADTVELTATIQEQKDAQDKLASMQQQLTHAEYQQRDLTLKRDMAIELVKAAVNDAASGKNPANRSSMMLAEVRGRQDILKTDLASLEASSKIEQEELPALQEQLVRAERQQRELTFKRDSAQESAKAALLALEDKKLRTMLPPQLLNVIPAAQPTEPVGPKRLQYSMLGMLASLLLTACIAVWMDRPRVRKPL